MQGAPPPPFFFLPKVLDYISTSLSHYGTSKVLMLLYMLLPIPQVLGVSLQSQKFGPSFVIMSEIIGGFFFSTIHLLFLFLSNATLNFCFTQWITNFKYPSLHSRTKPGPDIDLVLCILFLKQTFYNFANILVHHFAAFGLVLKLVEMIINL